MGELIELGGCQYLFFYGEMHTEYSTPSLEIKFLIFSSVYQQFVEEEILPPETFITIASHNFVQPTNKKKQFQVYRHLAWAVGYRKCTKFLDYIENAIKNSGIIKMRPSWASRLMMNLNLKNLKTRRL